MKEEISKKLNQILLKRTGIDFQKQEELQTEDFFGGKIKIPARELVLICFDIENEFSIQIPERELLAGSVKNYVRMKYMQKRLGKKVYRKMPTMQVLAGCACISLCNASGSSMSKMLSIMIAP